MFINTKMVEEMLTEKKNFRYFYYNIQWKRRFVLIFPVIAIISIFHVLFKGSGTYFIEYFQFNIYAIIVLFPLAVSDFLIEKFLARNLLSLEKEQKFKRLKLIWILEYWFFNLALWLSFRFNTPGFGNNIFDWSLFTFLSVLIGPLIIVLLFYFFQFNSLKLEIEEKGFFDKIN